ncbi:MAG: DUF262 domain-containing protein [Actinobacteria bacterium]|nr:DUF262 domain-containing protein [Actinomycetota bacterium]
MDDLSIRRAIENILEGRIRIPAFQRGFVWDPERVAFLMDSIYKGYPFGSILIWRTREQLNHEKDLGPYRLPDRDPELPIDYVLDGQQRLTSVFGVFQTDIEAQDDETWLPIYFDHQADASAQESQFVALQDAEVEADRHFPLNTLFNSAEYRQATEGFDPEVARRLDDMQAVFKEATIPVQTFETDNQAQVAIVFERVNRMGVELDTLQLLSAWTWSEDFDLQQAFADLSETLEPFGFKGVGEDTNLLLRCCAAVVAGDASPNALVSLNGAEVRRRFDEISNGIKGAIDFLRANLEIHSLKNLPYTTFLVPLSVFFATPGNQAVNITNQQRTTLLSWFWRSCFARRFSSGVLRNLKADIEEMRRLRAGQDNALANVAVNLDADFFLDNRFYVGTVNTKTFILLLAQKRPLSFVSGQPIDLGEVLRDYNRNEFHHVFPQAFLKTQDRPLDDINRLANFVFMGRQDNNLLGGVAPSEYRARMDDSHATEILDHAFCPSSMFADDYDRWVRNRAELLHQAAQIHIA